MNAIFFDILAFLIVVSIIVVIHEFGHFIVAKILGVKVEKFSLGFGPKIIGRKFGETEYVVSALPLGGYVKLLGEDPEEKLPPEDEKRSFSKLSPFKKFLIIFFGPAFNFILAIIILTTIFSFGKPILQSVVGAVMKGHPAAKVGLKKGDVITSINGKKISTWSSLSKYMQIYGKKRVTLGIKEGKKFYFVHIKPELVPGLNMYGQKAKRYIIGIYPSNKIIYKSSGILNSFYSGIKEVWFIIKITFVNIILLITQKIPSTDMGGPIMIAQLSGRAASMGISEFFYFIAVISVNIGLINLFPIPALDGGHLLFSVVEMIRRKPLSPKFQENAAKFGFALLIMLLLFVSYNDIIRIIKI
jgi:regulator of sigma E protease